MVVLYTREADATVPFLATPAALPVAAEEAGPKFVRVTVALIALLVFAGPWFIALCVHVTCVPGLTIDALTLDVPLVVHAGKLP